MHCVADFVAPGSGTEGSTVYNHINRENLWHDLTDDPQDSLVAVSDLMSAIMPGIKGCQVVVDGTAHWKKNRIKTALLTRKANSDSCSKCCPRLNNEQLNNKHF